LLGKKKNRQNKRRKKGEGCMQFIKEFFLKKGYQAEDGYDQGHYFVTITYPGDLKVTQSFRLEKDAVLFLFKTSDGFVPSNDVEKSFLDFLFVWEKLILKYNVSTVLVSRSLQFIFGRSAISSLATFSYFELSNSQISIAGWLYNKGNISNWARITEDSELQHYCNLFSVLFEAFDQKRKSDCLFDYTLNSYGEGHFKFYLDGSDEELQLTYDISQCLVTWSKKEYIVKTEVEMKEMIEDIFTRVEQRQRTKNIFQPPKKYFYRFCNQQLKLYDNEKKDSLYAFFQGKGYTYRQIEEFSVRYAEKFIFRHDGYMLFSFLSSFCLIDKDNQTFYLFSSEEEAKEKLKEVYLLRKEQELIRHLSSFGFL